MFKHILIPTDGSPVAAKAIKAGVKLAKEVGAKVTGYYALPPLEHLYYGDSYILDRRRIAEFERGTREAGQKHLATVKNAAVKLGVTYTSLMTKVASPYIGIVEAAKKQKCDAIVIASHGRGSLSSLVMGSVTQKVLAHSKIPVIVYR